MSIEVRHAALGPGFHIIFATAPSPRGPWRLRVNDITPTHTRNIGRSTTSHTTTTPDLMFGPGSCPALRYDASSGFWHMLYTPNPTVPGGDYRTWQIWAARSRTLASKSWALSPVNPVMVADAFDRRVHNPNIPAGQRGWASNTSNLNDSDGGWRICV